MEHGKLTLVIVILGTLLLVFQSCSISYLSTFCSLFPDSKAHVPITLDIGTPSSEYSAPEVTDFGEINDLSDSDNSNRTFISNDEVEETEVVSMDGGIQEEQRDEGKDVDGKGAATLPAAESSPVVSFKSDEVVGKSNGTLLVNPVVPILSSSMGVRKVELGSEPNTSYALHGGLVITNEPRQKHWMRNKIAESVYRVDWNGIPSGSMRPRWPSPRDKELLSARKEIQNAPMIRNDRDLFAPVFRNVSMFKRSYELMEQMFKVYIYKEGSKPIFHKPFFRGIYASEGWFMKQMEGNRRFVVKDPRKAHMFYLPYSSSMMRELLYVPNSHRVIPLAVFLKDYVDLLSRKYRFWNRTGGADHFIVACHNWGPFATKLHRELRKHAIKAICNADVSQGFFKLGKDVSLPQTNIRSGRNPLRDVGGNPASQRPTLAFFAGRMHGYLRPILLNHWEKKDTDMKIYGAMPRGVASKLSYIEHMKSSKYCICPRGYEVNSPRILEAIYYECVPVIISDNFVPPFFEVLNWDAFSVIIPEKDIPKLKEILLSIPEKKYLMLQTGVKRVQKHFLWHLKPVKYDIFHMILHSIWFNRLYQIKG
ncbi:probable glycosyltransferase At3g07620 isoform X3 [Nymphaea colorata]|uniref:probable glycosyltransferase At3g07620 isoform X3 n=1 Tax=Nymphaea colorata TaxID=210225 RepID=UPI00214EFA2D|nr:probable glycosyltransferase At3g07620 isoform X3 [Nymphaea colorata]